MANYWAERMAKSQKALTDKSINQVQNQLSKYYGIAMKSVIADFEATYDKLLATIEADKEPTPADLYKLDKYWQMQGKLRQELDKLGKKEISAFSKIFETNFFEVYYSLDINGDESFKTIDMGAVQQAISQLWVADGKSWSERIWGNTEKLAQTLNEELIKCIATGKKTSDLKKTLQERFKVSYSNADMIARTELAHIQTQAARQRYEDYGIQKVEVWVDEDERTCPVCASHEGEIHLVTDKMPVPFHPRCRCCMIPVIDDEEITEDKDMDTIKNNEIEMEKKHQRYIEILKKQGLTEEGIEILWNADEKFWDNYNGYIFDQNYNRFGGHPIYGMVNEYLRKHPEAKTEINKMSTKEKYDHFFVCIDCGEVVYKEHSKDNAQKRCPECQAKYRKKYKAQKEKERRAKKKLNN